MFRLLASVTRWLFSKTAMVLVLWLVVLIGAAAYLAGKHYMEQIPEILRHHQVELDQLKHRASQAEESIKAAALGLEKRLTNLDQEIEKAKASVASKQQEMRGWQERLETLKGAAGRAQNVLDLVLGTRRDHTEEQADLEAKINEARKLIGGFDQKVGQFMEERRAALTESQKQDEALKTEHKNLLSKANEKEGQVAALQDQVSGWEGRVERGKYWLRNAYNSVGKPLILITLSLLFAPLIGKVLLYFLWAPLIGIGRPVVIRPETLGRVDVSETKVSQEILLQPGECATIHHKFYQASDEDLKKRSKMVFSWRYPFSCVSAGLLMLTRATNRSADQPRRLVLSSQNDPDLELAVVEIPEGGALVCRPSFLAALVEKPGQRPEIRSHWRFFHLHSWITLQFRYFEFRGPVKLVVWAHRGVRAEYLSEATVQERRTNQLATIGFTPNLRYRSRRSETFLSYLRQENPLFDDLFSGSGLFLCQQISRSDRSQKVGRFWEAIWNGITKIFGI